VAIQPGTPVARLAAQDGLAKALSFLGEIKTQGAVFDWEINMIAGAQFKTLHFTGSQVNEAVLIVGAENSKFVQEISRQTLKVSETLRVLNKEQWMKKQPKILIAGGDPVIVSATRRVLESAGYETFSAEAGEQALEVTRAQRPDLLLLDLNLPKMDGVEVCRQIKADPALAGIFIILMTSTKTESESQVEGLNLGADGYIARPLANRELLARIQTMLRIQAGERALQASNAQWSATFDAVSEAIFLTDANDTILKCNQAATELWQQAPEALVGKKCSQVVSATEAPASASPLTLARETKRRQVLIFAQNERWLEAKVDPIFDPSGNFTGTVQVIADITERKQAEEALRLRESYLSAIIENQPGLLWLKDLNGRFLVVNDQFSTSCGLDNPEFLFGKTDLEIWPQELAIRYMADDLRVIKSGKPYTVEEPISDQGEIKWFETFKTPIIDKQGVVIGTTGFSREITERKQAEEELRQSEELLRVTLANIIDPVFITDNDGNFTFICSNVTNTLGYPLEKIQAIGKISKLVGSDLFNPEELEARGEITNLERIIVDSYGRQRVFLITIKQVSIGEGTRLYTLHDITERKQAEEALNESKLLLHLLIESLPQNIYAKDLDGRFVFANQRYCATQGKALEEIVGKTDFELHPLELAEKYRADDRQVMETGKIIELEEEHQPLGEKKFFVQMIKTPFYDSKGQTAGTLGIFWEITERKRADEKIRQLNAELEQRVEERTRELREAQEQLVRQEKLAVLGQLAGSVGHELRNPLGIINNAVYYLRLVQPEAEEQVKEYLGIIETETRTADKIISDLLDFSRIKSVDLEPVSVAALVQRTLERYPVPGTVQLTLNLPENLPTVNVDPHQVIQVLGNLVVNACQAMPGGGKLRVSSEKLSVVSDQSSAKSAPLITDHPSSALRAGCLLITVTDTGSGITPENLKKLFEPLFTTKPKGIGLGLAVSQKLVEANGGKIEVESEVGVGTTFTVYLPVSRELE